MVGDLKRIVGKLEVAFKSLAGYLTEIKISDLEKCPKDPKEFLYCYIDLYNVPLLIIQVACHHERGIYIATFLAQGFWT